MKPTLYLDSSVPSYWLPPERDDPIVQARHLLTRKWWAEDRSLYMFWGLMGKAGAPHGRDVLRWTISPEAIER